jgi:hypothetical protein
MLLEAQDASYRLHSPFHLCGNGRVVGEILLHRFAQYRRRIVGDFVWIEMGVLR